MYIYKIQPGHHTHNSQLTIIALYILKHNEEKLSKHGIEIVMVSKKEKDKSLFSKIMTYTTVKSKLLKLIHS